MWQLTALGIMDRVTRALAYLAISAFLLTVIVACSGLMAGVLIGLIGE